MIVLPYVKLANGEHSLSDGAMWALWQQIDVRWTFYDGGIRAFPQFLDYMQGPLTHPALVGENGRVYGLGWVTDIGGGRCFVHFTTFRKHRPGRRLLAAAKAIHDYWWSWGDSEPLIYTMVGLTPANNRPALAFAKRLGFTLLPDVPGLCEDAYEGTRVPGVISYLERPAWVEKAAAAAT